VQGRYHASLEDVKDFLKHEATRSVELASRQTEILEAGGVRLKEAGGVGAVRLERARWQTRGLAFLDAVENLDDINPEAVHQINKEPYPETELCPSCGSRLPREMVPSPPKQCDWRYDGGNEPCPLEAVYKVNERFACNGHLTLVITEVGGPVKVEPL
jgi:hypothetical protein